LIAAAPEMFALLKSGLEMIGGGFWCNEVEKLIAKIRGESDANAQD
jgi:hypothetical protein